jgi:hypothetical protein
MDVFFPIQWIMEGGGVDGCEVVGDKEDLLLYYLFINKMCWKYKFY